MSKVGYGKNKIYTVGALVNGTSFFGDIGELHWLKTPELSLPGVFYNYSLSPRLNWRFSYTPVSLKGKDSDSNIASRKERNQSFANTVHELMGGIEFSFNKFYDKNILAPKSEPYFLTGIALLAFKNSKNSLSTSFGLPFGVGYRWVLGSFAVNFELSAIHTLSDNLDYSEDNTNISNSNSQDKDWYLSTNISIGYIIQKCNCPRLNIR